MAIEQATKGTDGRTSVKANRPAVLKEIPSEGLHADVIPQPREVIEALSEVSMRMRSGRYRKVRAPAGEVDSSTPPGPLAGLRKEELRMDVDGPQPQSACSGTIHIGLATQINWVASLTPGGADVWTGWIWHKDGATSAFPYTNVRVELTAAASPGSRRAKATFSGGGAPDRVCFYKYSSKYFREVEFEYDAAAGTTPVTSVRTGDHPNCPPDLPAESLSIGTVFRRAGFFVRRSGGDGQVPLLPMAGADGVWSDAEMHDAMQSYWSKFADAPQWSLWVLFASLHVEGESLGGIMFDDIGPNHRQGTAIFTDAFISQAPAGDAAPKAWVRRMRFWTAVHEMGHAFNLAHSWQKSLGNGWVPLADEEEARSFMNYPYYVAGGETSFFADFEYGFSDAELLFMRHAPERFVQMGNADWFDDHGFEQALVQARPALMLELRANREAPVFDFMEPVVLELKLSNVSSDVKLVPESILRDAHEMTVVIKRDGQPARVYRPYAHYCQQSRRRALEPRQAVYESLFIAAGEGGWKIAEPGYYTVQLLIHTGGEEIVSNALRLRVKPPIDREEETVAQDFFSDEVGRIMSFDGSRFLKAGNDVLRDVVERCASRPVAAHARIALGAALLKPFKQLAIKEAPAQLKSASEAGGKIVAAVPDAKEARAHLSAALVEQPDKSARTLGHIDTRYYTERYTQWLAKEDEPREAAKVQKTVRQALANRQVLPKVIDEMAGLEKQFESKAAKPKR